MKRIIALMLALIVWMACLPVLGEGPDAPEMEETEDVSDFEAPEEEETPPPEYDYGFLRVGNPTRMKGDFFTDLWGNATSDLDVRTLIHGYNLILWDGETGMFTVNPMVVNGIVVTENGEGDRTYSLNLYSDLYYCDGTPITAYDYAFTWLFTMDPVVEKLGGKPLRKEHLLGYEEYIGGESRVLSGVRVLNDFRLDITIRHEYLPFFYEMGLLDCMPYPIHVIAPGCQVEDEGEGVYIEGDFSEETLRRTVLDPETGYRTHPAVTCGPYVLLSFDGVTAEFEINPWFKGDAQGAVPTIERIEYTLADNEDMITQLGQGEFGLLNKVTKSDTILEGIALQGTGYYAMSNYPRSGLTFISFNCEKPGVQSQAVRQAIACCTDKDQLVLDYVGNFGLRVEGFYGLGQWMYQMLNGTMAYPDNEEDPDPEATARELEELMNGWAEWVDEARDSYAPDTDRASELLEKDGWTLNRQGEAFRPGTDDVRCRPDENGALIALDLKLVYPEGNKIAESMEACLVPALREAGIALTLEPRDMNTLLDMFYQRTERDADMLYLGTDFDVVFDPSAHFVPGEDGTLTWNYTGATDEELYRLAMEMRMTQPGDLLSYSRRWLAFQQRFSETRPMIPIYSNVYFDFYARVLHDYSLNENVTWGQAVVRAYMSDMEDEEEEAEDEELDDDEMMFDD